MAEEIVQRLSFETGDSITSIDQLKLALDNLNKSISTSAETLKTFNTSGLGFDKALTDLTSKIDAMSNKISTGFSNVKPPNLTFDTSAALGQINKLTSAWGSASASIPEKQFNQKFAAMQTGLADYVAQNNLSRDQVIQAFAGTLSGSTPAINGLRSKVDELKTAFNTAGASGQAAGTKIGNFFSQLGRIVAFRAVISMLNDMSTGMQEGVQSASDFSTRLGQIGAIMDDTTLSLGGIRTALIATSNEFARPLGETTLAFYQTLQNQVGTAADSLYVFEQAAKLSAANVAPLNDSVNLLTAALKGWDLEVSRAGDLSGMFFEAIKIGRMEATDLADILGRIGPTAHAMGISIEESMGAVAIMTQQGTKASTAITQLSAIMTALLKPTKELKAAMVQKWGVENAEQALAKFGGLMGVLRQMEAVTGGSSDEMVKLTTNIRAVRAEMGLLGPNADAAEAAIKKLQDATVKTADAASKMVLDTAGTRYKQSVVELANAWTQFGETMLPVSTLFNQFKISFVEFASSTTAKVALLTAAFFGLAVAAKAYGTAMGVASIATIKWVAALALANPIAAAIIAAAVAIGVAYEFAAARSEANLKRFFSNIDNEVKQQTQTFNNETNKQTDIINKAGKERLQFAMMIITSGVKLYDKELASVKATQQAITDVTKRRFDAVLSAQQSYIQKLLTAETEGNQKLLAITEKRMTQSNASADKQFDLNTARWDKERQAQQFLTRADALRTEGLMRLAKAKTPEDLSRVEEFFSRAESYYGKAASGAATEREAQAIRQKQVDLSRDGLKVRDKEAQLAKADVAASKEKLVNSQAENNVLTDNMKKYEEGLKMFGGLGKTPKDQAAGLAQMQEAWTKIMEVVTKQAPQATDFLGIEKVRADLLGQLQNLPALNLKVQADLTAIQKQIAKPMSQLNPQQQKAVGPEGWVNLPEAVAKQYQASTEIVAKGTATLNRAAQLGNEIQQQIKASTKTTATGEEFNAFLDDVRRVAPELKPDIDAISLALKKMTRIDPADQATFQRELRTYEMAIESLKIKMATLSNPFDPDKQGGAGQTLDVKSLIKQLETTMKPVSDKIKDMSKLDLGTVKVNTDEAKAKLIELDSIITGQKVSLQGLTPSIQAMVAPVTDLNTVKIPAMDAAWKGVGATIVANTELIRQQGEVTAQEIAKINALKAQATASVSSFATGGIVYRAAGGPGRWTDTIMAMLSPGEIVVNATAAKQFAPQLQAMNAGSQPIFRDKGGPVTNVGDISVSVNGGDTSQQTIRQIGVGLQREIRRGTIRLS
ncbi:phage tail tape measure protein [Candidatus Pacearchaeota archaeon]|jgi:TP901 family phage tail tape measure protein|nr:phage tail tape measure protein [Candidatus Pacearchaeota archaeon]